MNVLPVILVPQIAYNSLTHFISVLSKEKALAIAVGKVNPITGQEMAEFEPHTKVRASLETNRSTFTTPRSSQCLLKIEHCEKNIRKKLLFEKLLLNKSKCDCCKTK